MYSNQKIDKILDTLALLFVLSVSTLISYFVTNFFIL